MIHAGADNFLFLTEIIAFQMTVIDEDTKTKQIEIDLLGKNVKKILLVGECKFKNTQFDKTEYENLLDKICVCFKSNDLHFSLSGFSDYVKENMKNCKLIGIDDMYFKGA